jgi:hypothetical protein
MYDESESIHDDSAAGNNSVNVKGALFVMACSVKDGVSATGCRD